MKEPEGGLFKFVVVETARDSGMDDSSQKSGKPPGVKPRPQLSKAERRALQEKQKADKAAAAAPSASKATNTPSEKSKKPDQRTTARPTPRQRLSISTAQHKDAASVVSADAENILKELRIFSHFASSNKSASSSKVEIHPAIVRLALQFSEFQIVGANARCLATITALKEVHALGYSSHSSYAHAPLGHS